MMWWLWLLSVATPRDIYSVQPSTPHHWLLWTLSLVGGGAGCRHCIGQNLLHLSIMNLYTILQLLQWFNEKIKVVSKSDDFLALVHSCSSSMNWLHCYIKYRSVNYTIMKEIRIGKLVLDFPPIRLFIYDKSDIGCNMGVCWYWHGRGTCLL